MTEIKKYTRRMAASGGSSSSNKGTSDNPYTEDEFFNYPGIWPGGYVEGRGYVGPDAVIHGSSSSSLSSSDSWDLSTPWDSWSSDDFNPWQNQPYDGEEQNTGGGGTGGGGGTPTPGGPNPGGYTGDYDKEENHNGLSLSDISKMTFDLNKKLTDSIKEAWRNGLILKGDGTYKSAAYYSYKYGKVFINDTTVGKSELAHEFTHILQRELGMMAGLGDNTGDANNELEGNLIQIIIEVGGNGGAWDKDWMYDGHNTTWMGERMNVDINTGTITLNKEFWDWLNDSSAMNNFIDAWVKYWKNTHNPSPEYIEGAQHNWDYKWDTILERLGIKHE